MWKCHACCSMSHSYRSHLWNKWRYLPVNIFCCLQHNRACIIDAARWAGAINLKRNGLYARFSINQHPRGIWGKYCSNPARKPGKRFKIERLTGCCWKSGQALGWFVLSGAFRYQLDWCPPAACVIVVQITVNTSPQGARGCEMPEEYSWEVHGAGTGRGRCDRNTCRAGRWGGTWIQSWSNMGKQWSLLAPASWANI